MIKKTTLATFSLFILLGFVFTTLGFSEETGNARKGKYTYRKIYEKCMERGEVKEAKPPISPDAKTQDQWKRVFDKKDFAEFGCKDEWDKLTAEELQNIFSYMHDHAADSPSPAKCK